MGRGIDKLHPGLIPICNEFVRRCKDSGLNVLVTETFRTKSEQDEIYAQGRTKPGNIISNAPYPKSPHCWGVAFDFCRNVKGREYDDSDGFFAKCGAVGKSLGLTWGGDWKTFVDKPHLEWTKYMPGSSTSWLIRTYGTPERFMDTWEAEEEMTQEQFNKMFAVAYAEMLTKQASAQVMPYAEEAWKKLTQNGIFDGTAPNAPLLRQDAALVIERLKGE